MEGKSGYTLIDDEGSKACKTYIIKDGVLNSRLHNSMTAKYFGENLTGNARSYFPKEKPRVRMTTTYLKSGTSDEKEMIRSLHECLY